MQSLGSLAIPHIALVCDKRASRGGELPYRLQKQSLLLRRQLGKRIRLKLPRMNTGRPPSSATRRRKPTMLSELIDLLESPEAHVCIWRDGELYIEPVAAQR